MAYNFEDKHALVTGGSRGIGKVIVKDLIDAGAEVFALAKTQINLDNLKSKIPNVNIIAVDLADWDATRNAVEKIGDINLLVNNAAFLDEKIADYSFVETPKDRLEQSINVNLKSAFNISQVVARNMIIRSSSGAIINVSSLIGLRPYKRISSYCVSKAGMDMMTKVMALELGPHNIRVNAVSPTSVRSDAFEKVMNKPDLKEGYNELQVRHPLGKRALVTGGSRGIGKVIVKDFIDAGAEVFAMAKTQINLDKLKSEIPSVNVIAVDLADWDATRIAVENVVARNMIKRTSGGAIIDVSSIASIRPIKGLLSYCISKAGMDMMTKVMALELGQHNIRVNTVSPIGVRTEFFEKRLDNPDWKKTYE
ncbi:hypothetical protein KUTeg_005638 [Tegillarca granosa]|uniref:L-xylulose reductase n=1 Tax=Tegillarca granosa TaxID=220873 RepID=A0ABQ9FKD9_TEGGR|nr:hypothetical protein KUTeg_005638 [Tegillarca granosa]